MPRKIYIASSWKNAKEVRLIARLLEDNGHNVYDFTDQTKHFAFNLNALANAKEIEYIDFLKTIPESRKAFETDKQGLDWSDTVILLNPCGRSSHLELGYGIGQGKEGFIIGDLPKGEFECMYHFAKACFRINEIPTLISYLGDFRF